MTNIEEDNLLLPPNNKDNENIRLSQQGELGKDDDNQEFSFEDRACYPVNNVIGYMA